MLYIYRRRNSTGARDLRDGIQLQGTPARRTKGEALRRLVAGDAVLCWGDNFAAGANIRTLNNVPPLSKYNEARRLAEKGVPTVQVSLTRPVANGRVVRAAVPAQPAQPGVRPNFHNPYPNLNLTPVQAGELNRLLAQYLAAPLPPGRPATPAQPAVYADHWLARRNNHIGGNDLLEDLTMGDFYSKKEDIVEEYRLHMFGTKSIRAGQKVKRAARPDGHTPAHDWIRSFDAGWIIQYDGYSSTKEQRKIASDALKALDLDFGAVDIGKRADGSLIVLEVNRAPGVEGGTIAAYAKHVIAWFNGQQERE